MQLSKGMINNLWHSIMWFQCENCGPEQKKACEEIDECELKLWLEEQESEERV